MEIAINGATFSLVEIIVWVIVGAVCAGIAQAIVGYSPGGLLLSIVIGLLVDGADFSRAITYIAAMALAGSLSYGLLVGKVERIDA